MAMGECVVYWLFDQRCICPWRHGYIGISCEFEARLTKHRKCQRWPEFQTQILARGTKAACLLIERQMRPAANIGWNVSVGGKPVVYLTEASRQKMSDAARLRTVSAATKEKLRIAFTGRTNRGRVGQKKSAAEIEKIAAATRGKKRSADFRQRRSIQMIGNRLHLGHQHSDETKRAIRETKTGVAVHSDEHKQKLRARWANNSLTKGKPWPAARRLAWLNSKET